MREILLVEVKASNSKGSKLTTLFMLMIELSQATFWLKVFRDMCYCV